MTLGMRRKKRSRNKDVAGVFSNQQNRPSAVRNTVEIIYWNACRHNGVIFSAGWKHHYYVLPMARILTPGPCLSRVLTDCRSAFTTCICSYTVSFFTSICTIDHQQQWSSRPTSSVSCAMPTSILHAGTRST